MCDNSLLANPGKCYGYFSIAVRKYHSQKKFQKEGFISLGLQRGGVCLSQDGVVWPGRSRKMAERERDRAGSGEAMVSPRWP